MAVWLQLVWLATVLVLRYACDVPLWAAIDVGSAYSVGFTIIAMFAIRRYLTMLLVTYVIFLISSLSAVFLIYMGPRLPFYPLVTVVCFTGLGLYGPIILLAPLAKQKEEIAEDIVSRSMC